MTVVPRVLLLLSLLLAAACGGGGSPEPDSASSATDSAPATETAASDSRLTASTMDGAGSSVQSTETASIPQSDGESTVTGSSSTTETTSTETTSTETTSTETTSTETSATGPPSTGTGSVLEPGDLGAFASPSGNILCLMSSSAASCWISEKSWTIDQPAGPGCEDSDWGNMIDVTADGVYWPCYTDFGFDPDAAALAYGDAMVVGGFRCDSARTGVTCRNPSGRGFTLARAEVQLF